MRLAALALLTVTTTAISQGACVGAAATFPCEVSSQCVQGGTPGTCEPIGFCSFPDPTCPTGSRFAVYAPAAVAASCTTAGAPDGGRDDAAVPDAEPARCGGTRLLADDFEDGVVFGALWDHSFDDGEPPMLAEQGGRAIFTYEVDVGGTSYAEYRSTRTYDLRADRVFIEVPTTPDPTGWAQAYLGVYLEDGRRIDLIAEHGNLVFNHRGPELVRVGSLPLTSAHRWWQIRERDGMVFYETSADGLAFATRAMIATTIDLSAVHVHFGGGTWQAEPEPGSASFDNLNGGTPSGTECP